MAKGVYDVELVESVFNALVEVVDTIGTEAPEAPSMGGWTDAQLDEHLVGLGLPTAGNRDAKEERVEDWYNLQLSDHEKALAAAKLVLASDGGDRISLAAAKAQVG